MSKYIPESIETTELCSYGCGGIAKYKLSNGKLCCNKNWQSCPESRKKRGESGKGKHIGILIETNKLCSYGCGQIAKFKLKNGKLCCSEKWTDCLENKKRNKIIVEKPCWNFKFCGNKVKVNINVGNINVTCDECKTKNLFHPTFIKNKNQLSEQTKLMNKDQNIINKRNKTLKNRSIEEIKNWKLKRRKTLNNLYGEDWKTIQHDKTKSGMLKKYGKEYALQIDEFKQQANETYFLKTGYTHPMKDPENIKKIFDQRDEKEIAKKVIETNIKRYNGPSPMCSPNIVKKANYTRFLNQKDRILKYLSEIGFEIIGDYIDAHKKCIFKHIGGCGYEWESSWNNLWNYSRLGNPCPNCKPKNTNNKLTQNNIQTFIESLGFTPLVDNRSFLEDNREIDFIIEEENIAIEYCGLYWHSHEMLTNTRKKINDVTKYHLSKLEICENKNYKLITIFEDEWVEKKQIVKSRLKQILNKSNAIKIHARKCIIIKLNTKTKINFLNNFHIQGANDGAFLSYGAFDENNNLIAIMTFGKPRDRKNPKQTEWELKRFCTNFNFHSAGIANKLLTHFKRNNKWERIISYADRRWSNGNLYEKLNFKLENKGGPSPWFVDVNKVKRYHRSKMWKTKKDIESGLTQNQLAVIKGYKIIYDCGNLKYIQTQ